MTDLGFSLMLAKRMVPGRSVFMDRASLGRLGRKLRLAACLALAAVTVAACGTGPLLDKFTAKDEETFSDEPADKLYNEGLFLMNKQSDLKAATKKFDEVDREHPYSEWARKSLLMSA